MCLYTYQTYITFLYIYLNSNFSMDTSSYLFILGEFIILLSFSPLFVFSVDKLSLLYVLYLLVLFLTFFFYLGSFLQAVKVFFYLLSTWYFYFYFTYLFFDWSSSSFSYSLSWFFFQFYVISFFCSYALAFLFYFFMLHQNCYLWGCWLRGLKFSSCSFLS